MINGIISKYLGANKRLVVPELGSFIRKDGGEVAFVEFLKKDDGVLAALIVNELGLGAEEAAEVLAGYVDGVRRAVAMSGRYIVDGVGVIASDANGLLSMGGDAAGEPVMEVVEVVRQEVVVPTFSAPEPEPVSAFRVPEPAKAPDLFKATEPAREPAVEPVWASRPEPVPEPEPVPAWTPPVAPKEPEACAPEQAFADTFADKKALTINDLYSSPEPEEEEPAAADWFSSPETARERSREREYRPQIRRRAPQKRNKTDLVMIIAIVAAALAIGSMVLGMLRGGNPAVRQSTEQVVDSLGVEVVEVENGAANS